MASGDHQRIRRQSSKTRHESATPLNGVNPINPSVGCRTEQRQVAVSLRVLYVMKRQDIGRALARKQHVSRAEAQDQFDALLHSIRALIREGRSAEIPGLGLLVCTGERAGSRHPSGVQCCVQFIGLPSDETRDSNGVIGCALGAKVKQRERS